MLKTAKETYFAAICRDLRTENITFAEIYTGGHRKGSRVQTL